MRNHEPLFPCIALVLVALSLLACGQRQLQSLSVSPATADAQNFPNGQVQFTAMGSYGGMSQPTAVNALWWTFTPWSPPPPLAATVPTLTITPAGLATCIGVGTFTLWATAPVDQSIPVSQMTRSTKQLSATAQLTCP